LENTKYYKTPQADLFKVIKMPDIKIKGQDIKVAPIKDSFNRRALLFKNKVISILGLIGVKADDVIIELEGMPIKKIKASAEWYFDGHRMYYENNSQSKYVENLFVVMKVIENEVNLVLEEKKPIEEFVEEFREEEDVLDKRKEAREFFGLTHDHQDMEVINKKYKEMAKDLHPDMPNGSTEKFKKLNEAHKTLKRELN
jgi:hypothetical protein